MANNDLKFKVNIDKKALDWFSVHAPQKLQKARRAVVESAGMIWADEAKDITTQDDHIKTGLYVNSIGYVTNFHGKEGGRTATEADVINEIAEDGSKTTLTIGSGVAYASSLEKRYNIMARALDASKPRIRANAWRQVRKELFE